MIKCPNADCGYENVDGTQFCEGCGEELPQNGAASAAGSTPSAASATSGAAASTAGATAIKCPACDNLNDPANEFCEVCGTALHDKADASSAPAAAPSGSAAASAPAMPAGVSASTPGTPSAPTAASGSVLTSGSGAAAASPDMAPMAAATVGAGATPPDVSISGLSDTSAADAMTPVVAIGDTTNAVTPSAVVPASPSSGINSMGADDTAVSADPVAVAGASTPDTSSAATAPVATAGGELAPGRVKLTVEQGMTIGKQFVLGDSEMQVGREDDEEGVYPDIDLSDQDEGYVHRKHATLKFENGGLTLMHLGGANKTRINNRPLPDNEAQPVNLGDKIAFGKVVMRVGAM